MKKGVGFVGVLFFLVFCLFVIGGNFVLGEEVCGDGFKEGAEVCDGNDWCLEDCTVDSGYVFLSNCTEPDWCDGNDLNQDGGVTIGEYIESARLKAIPPEESQEVSTILDPVREYFGWHNCSADNSWCYDGDRNQDGSVTGTDLSIVASEVETIEKDGIKIVVLKEEGKDFINDSEVPQLSVISQVSLGKISSSIVIGKPVKHIKTVRVENMEGIVDIDIELPLGAEEISVKTGIDAENAISEINEYEELIDNADRRDIRDGKITGLVSKDVCNNVGVFEKLYNWFVSLIKITGKVVYDSEVDFKIIETTNEKIIDVDNVLEELEEELGVNISELAVEYYTEAPKSIEENIHGGKKIIISAPDDLGYENVLAYTLLENKFLMEEYEKIFLYWNNNETGNLTIEEVWFDYYDLDEDGFIDYIEWIVPHLSEQIYVVSYAGIDYDPDGYLAGCMDKREAWNTSYNPYRLYLRSWDYNVSVNDADTTIYVNESSGNGNPYILLDLQEDQELLFEINFTNSSGYSYTETKNIAYRPICSGDCSLYPTLADESFTNISLRNGNNVLFNRTDLQRLMNYDDSDNALADYLYYILWAGVNGYAGSSDGGAYPYKVIENLTQNGTVFEVLDTANFTIDFPISRNFNLTNFQYIEVLDGVDAGKFKLLLYPSCLEMDKSLDGNDDTYRCTLIYSNTGVSNSYIGNEILSPPSAGTNVSVYQSPGTIQNILCYAGLGYKLKQEGWQGVPNESEDVYYFLARDILLLDPMLGTWDSGSAHNAKCWGMGYDAIKERLVQEDIDNGTNYDETIRNKIATLMDWWVWTGWDYNMEYIYSSEGVIADVFADYVPPRGSNMTGPREWMDRVLFKYDTYINTYFSANEGRSGIEYGETSSADILTFALAHKRTTGKDIISEGPLGDYVKTRFKLQFGDRGQPLWGPSPQVITQRLSAFQSDYFFTEITGFNEMAEWMIQEAITQENSRKSWLYAGGANFLTYASLYDTTTEAISPSVFMQSDEEWRPTQFIPEANEVMFRDNWNYSSRNFFLMGKPDNVRMADYYATKFFYNGHVRYYEDGEHFFGSDPTDSRLNYSDPTRYQHAILTADGFYSASYLRVNAPTGDMKHEFSYYDDLDYFVQTAQVDAYYLVPGEELEVIEDSLDEWYYKIPDDIPLPINDTNVYPDDVNYSRQVLYLKDYILIFDDMEGERDHLYEMTLPTYRVPEEVSVSGNYASVAGVENLGFYYKRDPDSTAYTYIPSEEAKRVARIYALGNTFEEGSYGPASQSMDVDNARITQSETGQNVNFLTVVSSDNNSLAGDELNVSEISISNGKAASLTPSSGDYEDVVIVHDTPTLNTETNDVDFTGLLGIVRVENSFLKDFYVKKGTGLSYGGRNYFSGDVYQASLSYVNSTDVRGFVDMEESGSIQVYSSFNPGNVDFEMMDEYWPYNDSVQSDLDYSYSGNILTIEVPLGRGLLKIYNPVSTSVVVDPSDSGSGGGGGGIVIVTPVQNTTVSVVEVGEGYWEETSEGEFLEVENKSMIEKELGENERISFLRNGTTHYVGVMEIDELNGNVLVGVSVSQGGFDFILQDELNFSNEKKFDLDDDGYYDVTLSLNSIDFGGAKVYVESIHEEVPFSERLELPKEEEGVIEEVFEAVIDWFRGLFGF
jgi:hypothetical protein